MNESERVDWVRAQADCLLHRLFKNLYEIVEDDLKQANQCSPLEGFTFILDPDTIKLNGQFTVTRQPPPNSTDFDAVVTFTRRRDCLSIVRHMPGQDQQLLKVEAQWDHDRDTCGITINKKRNAKDEFYKPWQISREALSPIIFP